MRSTCCRPILPAAAVSPVSCRLARSAKRITSICRDIARRRCTVTPPVPLQQVARLALRYSPADRRRRRELTKRAGRRLNGSAAMLAFSVLADSAIEHYRGSFQNRAMYVPLAVSTLTLGGSLFGVADARPDKHIARDVIYGAAAATAFAGL